MSEQTEEMKSKVEEYQKHGSYQFFAVLMTIVLLIGGVLMVAGFVSDRRSWLDEGMSIFMYTLWSMVLYDIISRVIFKYKDHRFAGLLVVAAVILLTALVFTSPAQAAEGGLSAANAPMKEYINTGATAANKLLCATIGDVGGTGLFGSCEKKDGVSNFQNAVKIFNVAIFSIASIIVVFNLLTGVMSSAADGEFLGKKNSSTWAPLRMLVGGAMLIPAFGGFNLAQLLMVWATAVGVGFAGMAVSAATPPSVYSVPSTLVTADQVEQALSTSPACVGSWTGATKRLFAESQTPELENLKWGMVTSVTTGATKSTLFLKFGATAGGEAAGYTATDCGVVSFSLPVGDATTDRGAAGILTSIAGAMQTQIPTLAQAYITVSTRLAETGTMSKEDAVRSNADLLIAKFEFDKSMQMAASMAVGVANSLSGADTKAKGDWVGVGFVHVDVAKNGATINKDAASTGKVTPPTRMPPAGTGLDAGELPSYDYTPPGADVSNEPSLLERLKNMGKQVVDGASQAAAAILHPVETFNDLMKKAVDALGRTVASSMSSYGKAGPVGALVSLGLDISGWAFGTIMAYLAAIGLMVGAAALAGAFAPVLLPAITLTTSLLNSLWFLMIMLVVPLIFFGVKLAAYIPFLTSIIWAGVILNWLVVVVEAIFGAPLWALAHLDMEGDGMNMQKTGHGYMFLFNLLFRPVMLVGLFYAAQLIISAVFGVFLDVVTTYISSLSSGSASWWADLISIIGAVWVVIAFAENIVTTGMGMLFATPDAIFNWIGGRFNSSTGGQLEQSVSGSAKGGLTNMTQTMGQAVKVGGMDRGGKQPGSRSGGGTIGSGSGGGSKTPPPKPGNNLDD